MAFSKSRHFRVLAPILALGAALGGISCLGDDSSPLPAPPFGARIVYPASFHMGEPDLIHPPGGRRVDLTRPFAMSRLEFTLGETLPLLNSAWRSLELFLQDDWLWHEETGMPLLDLYAGDQFDFVFAGDSFALAFGAIAELPLHSVSWYGAALVCDWRNRAEGLPDSYERNGFDWPCGPAGNPYRAEGWRLPTEAEWELAARFPDDRRYPWGNWPPDCTLANGRPPEGPPCEDAAVVGSSTPAGDGWYELSDQAGNLREWCTDWYAAWEFFEPLEDPWDIEVSGLPLDKVLRGGSWAGSTRSLESWYREHALQTDADRATGFRMARRWTGE